MPAKGNSKYQVGNRFDSKYGEIVIVEYISPRKLLIRFEESGYEYWTSSTRIVNNELRDRSKARVFGVGINDLDYNVETKVSGKRVTCPYYRVWRNMLARCYLDSGVSYHNCTVVPEWLRLSVFKAWMETQDWEGKQLDKDLFGTENKQYGPDTCVFLTNEINQFIKDKSTKRGGLPLGVSKRRENTYIAQGKLPSRESGYLGSYRTAEEAHNAWKVSKHEEAVRLCKTISCPRTIQALLEKYP